MDKFFFATQYFHCCTVVAQNQYTAYLNFDAEVLMHLLAFIEYPSFLLSLCLMRVFSCWHSTALLWEDCMSFRKDTQDTTGRRRYIGCLNLQVIFRNRSTNSRALLRKMTYKDKASYGSSPTCTTVQRVCELRSIPSIGVVAAICVGVCV